MPSVGIPLQRAVKPRAERTERHRPSDERQRPEAERALINELQAVALKGGAELVSRHHHDPRVRRSMRMTPPQRPTERRGEGRVQRVGEGREPSSVVGIDHHSAPHPDDPSEFGERSSPVRDPGEHAEGHNCVNGRVGQWQAPDISSEKVRSVLLGAAARHNQHLLAAVRRKDMAEMAELDGQMARPAPDL